MARHDHAAQVRGEQDAADRGEHSAGDTEDCEDCEDNGGEEDLHILQNWLTLIEANYHATNSYHNSSHAADVLQVKKTLKIFRSSHVDGLDVAGDGLLPGEGAGVGLPGQPGRRDLPNW